MARLSVLVLGLVTSALLAVVPSGTAAAASPEGGTIVTVELDLRTSNGLRAHLATDDEETVRLEIGPPTNGVVYEVKGQVTEAGLKARFGRLGTIDVAFAPTRTLSSTAPSEGCSGAPRTWREGVFIGTVDFTGERGYVRLEGPRAAGSMSVISQWACPEPAERPLRDRIPGPLARSSQGKKVEAMLYAATRRCSCLFAAGVQHGGNGSRSSFDARSEESREGMEITRFALVRSSASAFVLDREEGTATLRPPEPFSGRATFEDRPGARDRWRGAIWIALLGLEPIRLGPGTRAILIEDQYHFDSE